MPDDRNQNIEGQLKAYAARRRAQARTPWPMPPATRRLLHSELDRLLGAKPAGEEPRLNWWRVFWPYLILGGSATAALAVGLMIWLQEGSLSRHGPELAKLERAPAQPKQGQESAARAKAITPEATVSRGFAPAPPAPAPSDRHGGNPTPPSGPGFGREGLARSAHPAPTDDRSLGGGLVETKDQLSKEKEAPAATPLQESVAGVASEARLGLANRVARPEANGLATAPAPSSLSRGVGVDGREEKLREVALQDKMEVASQGKVAKYGFTYSQSAKKAIADVPAAPSGALSMVQNGQTPAPTTTATALALDTVQLAVRFADTGNAAPPAQSRYQQVDVTRRLRRNFNSPPRPSILNDFQLQQIGQRIELRDADGSIYEGPILRSAPGVLAVQEPAVAAAASRYLGERDSSQRELAKQIPTMGDEPQVGKLLKGVAQPPSGPVPLGQVAVPNARANAVSLNVVVDQVFFNALGTNISTGQRVVFDGRLVITNSELMSNSQRNAANQSWSLNNSAVVGRATIGGRTRVEVNAPATQSPP